MDMVALVPGSGREVAGLPLPAFDPERVPVLDLDGDMAPDDAEADPIRRLTSAVAQAERLATSTAAFRDELVATAYREGAAEYAARLTDRPAKERREWGARGMLAELASALRLPESTLAKRLARHAALAAFPRFREANLAGVVSSWHCDVMLDIFGGVADEAALAAADEAMIAKALTSTASELRVMARRWRARHIPRTADERQRNLTDRRVEVAPAGDDLCWLTALLPAAQAIGIYHRLSDVAAKASGPDEPRTPDQLRADALCELLLAGDSATGVVAAEQGMFDAGAGDRPDSAAHGGTVAVGDGFRAIVPTVVVTVPVLSLLGHSDEPADLEGFGPIDIETARDLCALAPSFIRVLTHPETGAVLSVGRGRYRVPADLKAALVVRDETCRFPGCRRRAMRCDLDHSTDWQYGGVTGIENLAHLCRKHHRLKHQLGWRVAHHEGGALTWTSPAGALYRTEPAIAIHGPRRATAPPGTTARVRTAAPSGQAAPSGCDLSAGYDVPSGDDVSPGSCLPPGRDVPPGCDSPLGDAPRPASDPRPEPCTTGTRPHPVASGYPDTPPF